MCQTEAACSSGAKRKYFLTSAQGSLRNLTFKIIKIPFEGLDHYPKVSKQEKGGVRQVGFVPPGPPLYRGRDSLFYFVPFCSVLFQPVFNSIPRCFYRSIVFLFFLVQFH